MSTKREIFISHDSIPKEHRPSSGIRGLAVLVVDDNVGDAHLLEFWLQRLGCTVHCAKDGSEAISLNSQKVFDFILMDLDMPCVDGYEATRVIRGSEAELSGPRKAIIAISGSEDSQVISQCESNGMDGYFTKPVCPRELAFVLAEINDKSNLPNAKVASKSSSRLVRNKP